MQDNLKTASNHGFARIVALPDPRANTH
jgi:hypothetical protein